MVERAKPLVWDVPGKVITEHHRACVTTLGADAAPASASRLRNSRCLCLHRKGKAYPDPPLAGRAFQTRTFDGDQCPCHVRAVGWRPGRGAILRLSTNNILKPADGKR